MPRSCIGTAPPFATHRAPRLGAVRVGEALADHRTHQGRVDAALGVQAVHRGQPLDEVLAICRDEIARVVEKGLTDAELIRGKGQVRGSIVLSLEDPSSRMSRLGTGRCSTLCATISASKC